MNNKTIKLFALAATLLVATQPLSAAWYDDIFKPKYLISALVGVCGLYASYRLCSSWLNRKQSVTNYYIELIAKSPISNDKELKQQLMQYAKDNNTPVQTIEIQDKNTITITLDSKLNNPTKDDLETMQNQFISASGLDFLLKCLD